MLGELYVDNKLLCDVVSG